MTWLSGPLRERIRYLHYSLQTEKADLHWVRLFIRWHGLGGVMRNPFDLCAAEAESFLHMLAKLPYGAGVRLMAGLRLCIQDVDLDRRVLAVRDGRGGKGRVVMLPQTLAPALKDQLLHARAVWDAGVKAGRGGVQAPPL